MKKVKAKEKVNKFGSIQWVIDALDSNIIEKKQETIIKWIKSEQMKVFGGVQSVVKNGIYLKVNFGNLLI